MPLEYRENKRWENILPVLEEHTYWFHQFVENLFYADEDIHVEAMVKPSSFAHWVVYANRENKIQPEIVEKLSALHSDLFKMADILFYTSKETGAKPQRKDFKNFMTIYEEFLAHIRRLEKDMLAEGSGYDSFTGLRSADMLPSDIEKELDRLARQGKSFCVALARIDNFELIRENTDDLEEKAYVKLMADLIKLSIRSFDDAYYLGDDEYALCLKQADVSGGISALERLRKELEHQDVTLQLRTGEVLPLSMSCCIAEPVAGQDVAELIRNLREDLDNTDQVKTDTVLEYHELSPLQRYVQDQGGSAS